MIPALKLKQSVEEGLVPYRNIFRNEKSKKLEITVYIHTVTPSVPVSLSFPSISSTPRTARPTPLPSQPTQHEDDKNEDPYDYPLPLNE